MLPKKTSVTVVSKVMLSDVVWEIRFNFGERIEMNAGQYISIKVNDAGMRRSYSVARIGDDWVEILVDVSPMGVGSKYILDLNIGDIVDVIAFLGSFVVEKSSMESPSVLFVATGTGIAPFFPMLEEMISGGYKGKIDLWWGMRYEKDLYWWNRLEELKTQCAGFEYKIVLSREGGSWNGERGHVGDLVEKRGLDWNNIDTYLCGSKEMIVEVKELLVNKGVDQEKIYYEKFY